MANKLFESLKGGATPAPSAAPANFWQQVEQMQRDIPNPRAEVEKLLQSGQMSREEFQRLGNMANQMMRR